MFYTVLYPCPRCTALSLLYDDVTVVARGSCTLIRFGEYPILQSITQDKELTEAEAGSTYVVVVQFQCCGKGSFVLKQLKAGMGED